MVFIVNWTKRVLIALSLGTMCFSALIRVMTDPLNRFYAHWEIKEGASIILGILILTVIALAVDALVRRIGHPMVQRLFRLAYLVVLGLGLVTLLWPIHAAYWGKMLWMCGAWAVIGGVMVYCWFRPRGAVFQGALNASLILSPLFFIVSFSLLNYQQWVPSSKQTYPPSVKAVSGKTPIYIFIFDEWSFKRSFDNGTLKPMFRRLAQFAEQSCVFLRNKSPGPDTNPSLPRFVCQTEDDLMITDKGPFWRDKAGVVVPASQKSNLFKQAAQRGYATYSVGFHIPPNRILFKTDIDYEEKYPFAQSGQTLLEKTRVNLRNILLFSKIPISALWRNYAWNRLSCRDIHNKHTWITQRTMNILRDSPDNAFCFFHMVPPHCPYFFNPDGSVYRDPSRKGDVMVGTLKDYEMQLGYVDNLMGQFLDAIKKANRYQESLIVVTSDHSWRKDKFGTKKDVMEQLRDVPLFIKLPGQTRGRVITEPFTTTRLGPLLTACMEGRLDESGLIKLMQDSQ